MEGSRERTRSLVLETAVVLCLAVLPDVVHTALVLQMPASRRVTGFQDILLLLRSLQVSVPVLWIMHRSGDVWERFGLRRVRPLKDAALALAAIAVALLATGLVRLIQHALGGGTPAPAVHGTFALPQSAPQWALLSAALLANSFAEELVMRGYLIPRLEELLRSRLLAVATPAILFAAYHLYQGVAAAVAIGLMALLWGLLFLRTRRLWPLVLAHTLWNLLAFAYAASLRGT